MQIRHNNFEYFQPNKKKKKACDCAIRAIAKALNISWVEAFDLLAEEARKQQDSINSREVYGQVLLNHNFIYNKLAIKKGSKRPKVFEAAKQLKNQIAVFNVANHVVTAQNGKYYDIWDSGDCCLYGYYTKG